ncbi:hypothetical protein NEF87_001434 [Candidatus Lokiarchaeum ossiferum]|uniref:5-formyltetrahydrofolate cyclo-ligase n=1 Tax=Candidatus Lokiarchaeum ossiferum TaxID=2951803 RepID=A0ABY6HRQ5_9ARCH|nr:hypothetical protein NEF87_001434 [Candidatus Lokiarchaeum sp. B-35]
MELPREPQLLRKAILQKRNQTSLLDRNLAFSTIKFYLLDLPEFQNASSILGYYGKSSSGEFDTSSLLAEIISMKNKRLFLPRCDSEKIALDLYFIQNLTDDIEKGAYGIMEPKIRIEHRVPLTNIDLIFVPGSVFDRSGRRYGYGAGYYDSLLQKFQGIKIAFAFEFTVMDFPLAVHSKDVPVDIIITPSEIIRAIPS